MTLVSGSPYLIPFIHRVTALADADPLGVNQNVTFDEVGGLDERKTTYPTYEDFIIEMTWNRYSFAQGDDCPTITISRSIPALQPHPSSWSVVPWPAWNRKNPFGTRTCS